MTNISHYFVPGGPAENPAIQYRDAITYLRVGTSDPTHSIYGVNDLLDDVGIAQEKYRSLGVILANKEYYHSLAEQFDTVAPDRLDGMFTPNISLVVRKDDDRSALYPLVFVDAEQTNGRKFKRTLLHELGHFARWAAAETIAPAPYLDPRHIHKVKTIGKAGILGGLSESVAAFGIAGLTDSLDTSRPMPFVVSGLLAATVSIQPYTDPFGTAWLCTREEQRAEWFAFKHRKADIARSRVS